MHDMLSSRLKPLFSSDEAPLGSFLSPGRDICGVSKLFAELSAFAYRRWNSRSNSNHTMLAFSGRIVAIYHIRLFEVSFL